MGRSVRLICERLFVPAKQFDWDAIRRYYESGRTMRECKERFGFSNHAWDRAVASGRIVPRKQPIRKGKGETRSAVERLLADGLSQSAVAFQLRLSRPTVAYHARKLGIDSEERLTRRYDWAAVQKAHDAGLSARECCVKFGFSSSAWYQAIERGALIPRPTGTPIEELLVAGRPRGRDHLKRRLLKAGLKEERCERCGLNTWRDEPLRVTLHHINGDGYDNRLENLEFLCPNCHSQTSTYGGRNGHRRKRQ